VKIATILGARPQFIKAAAVSKIIKKNNKIDEIIIHTGQHYDNNMSRIFFNELEISDPDYNLNINHMSHGKMTGLMLSEIEKILINENPKGVLVYGDTNSTLAGSLAADKLNIPVFHIEAGLRSYNRLMPEETNRILTDHISTLLFCPTRNSINLLAKEGIVDGVHNYGDVMYDLFQSSINDNNQIDQINSPFILATIHRPVNTENPKNLKSIFLALESINKKINVIFPIHPRTEKKLKEYKINPNFKIIPPLSYKNMLEYLISADLVITDSGGVQKESYFSKTKCITIRSETEWTELIDIGANILCKASKESILDAYNKMRKSNCDFTKKLYGNGNAALKIVEKIEENLK
jgi:UDP-GlcNAc3NAcA epimerase